MDIEVTKVFDKNWPIDQSGDYRYIVNSGGSRSSKTFSLLQIFSIKLQMFKNYKITCYRNLRVDAIDTMYKDFEKIVDLTPGYEKVFKKNIKDAYFRNKKNGSTIYFAGTEKVSKALGTGNDEIFLNEISEFPEPVFDQLDQRCRNRVWIDYNPSKQFWVEKYRKNEDAIFIHSTYKDNQFLTEGIIKKLESYNPYEEGSTYVEWFDGVGKLMYKGKPVTRNNLPPPNIVNVKNGTADRYLYEVYCLGIGSEKLNRVLTGWRKCTPAYFKNLPYKSYFGLDFGISAPTAMSEVKYDGDRTFYVRQRLYRPSSTMGMPLYQYIKDKIGIASNDLIVADSAKATMITDLQVGGLMAVGALKGAGSINRRLTQLQSFSVVYTTDSGDLENEYENYSYKIDRYGLVTDEIDPKSVDHLIDATSYIISYLISYLSIKV